jgi:Clp protease
VRPHTNSRNSPLLRGGNATTAMPWGDLVYERLLDQRIVVLGQEVDDEIANRICAQMLLLAAEDPNGPALSDQQWAVGLEAVDL